MFCAFIWFGSQCDQIGQFKNIIGNIFLIFKYRNFELKTQCYFDLKNAMRSSSLGTEFIFKNYSLNFGRKMPIMAKGDVNQKVNWSKCVCWKICFVEWVCKREKKEKNISKMYWRERSWRRFCCGFDNRCVF